MKREAGDRNFPIWLIGDSNPRNWQDVLTTPLDPRHPARHNIWTPILDVLQDQVYRQAGLRLETRNLYIRNAIEAPDMKPSGTMIAWDNRVNREVTILSQLLAAHQPVMVLTFGAFAFEFARRSVDELPHTYRHWSTRNLGDQFRQRTGAFNVHQVNILSLLHATIARGRFLTSHEYFCDASDVADVNYFAYTGEVLARLLLQHRDVLPVWIARDR